jgi:ABC-2 type transport system permease protein
MNTLPLLLKREYWEHRGGFLWTPIWVTGVTLAITVFGLVTAEVFRSRAGVNVGFSLDMLRQHLEAKDYVDAGYGLDVVQFVFGALPCVGLFFVLFFYLLGGLYDDRRDRSVLFWKSLPVSDSATVVSKALSAMLVAPLIALAVSALAYLAFLLIVGLWLALHGLNILPAIAASHPLRTLWRMFLTVPLDALWALPAIGWLLFWSAWARSKPFLWAVMLPILVVFANWWVGMLGGPHFAGDLNVAKVLGRLLLSVMPGSWISADAAGAARMWMPHPGDTNGSGLLAPERLLAVLSSANLWLGVVAGLALLAGAIWLRGRRIEVNA